jgi:TPR repeat protein
MVALPLPSGVSGSVAIQASTGRRISPAVPSLLVAFAVAAFLAASPALALDPQTIKQPSSQQDPWEALRSAYDNYKSGHVEEAVREYRYAAEKGQLGAQWKLARMYADGDGVKRNDYEAFKFYSQVVRQGVDQGSVESAYVSDALVEIGNYIRTGIPGTPVKADPSLAQEYYRDAAVNYRNPQAQFELGRMFLIGDGVKVSVKQAGRWLQLAAEKGHAGAEATLGNLLYQRGKVVRGLAMMTAALERAGPPDRPWIFSMQEEAFSLASEADRRTAVALAQDMLAKGR